jgi:8-oxo-dGTP diphosphatase
MAGHPDVIEAAGGIVERPSPGGPVIAVIYRERYDGEWALPKGKRQPGESWQQTALREVAEETGIATAITNFAGATAYLANGVPKVVLYWRMKSRGQIPAFIPNDEVHKLEWLAPEEAMRRLTHDEEKELLSKI